MSNNKYGITSWDEVELKQPNAGGQKRGKDLYLKLDNGSNQVRVITKPHQYLVHVLKEEGDSGYGDKIKCSSFHGSCVNCDNGNKPKRRWLIGVIERKTGTTKILDLSVTVFKAIQELTRDEDYGDPSKYDIDIKVDKNGGATGYYTVIPKPPKPLSAADMEAKTKFDAEELSKRCTPPTQEDVTKIMTAIRNRKNGGSKQAVNATPVQTVDLATDDDDMDFPSAT